MALLFFLNIGKSLFVVMGIRIHCENGSLSITPDNCPYLVRYSLDVLKKNTKVLDIFNLDKKCFMRINIESSPSEIWIKIHFHNGSGSPSLLFSSLFYA